MPVMSRSEVRMCTSAPWRAFARRIVLPWGLQGESLEGSVLEVGGGSGAMAEALLEHHPDVHLTVTDLDPTMTTSAAGRLDRFGGRATVEVADATSLPFADGSFDAVVSFLMLHHVGQWQSALDELGRVLRPGGRLIGFDLTPTLASRGFHRLDHSPVAPLTRADLASGLDMAGFATHEVRPQLLGTVMRFAARTPTS